MYVIDTRIRRRARRNLLVLLRKNHGSDPIALNTLDFVPGVGLALQHSETQRQYHTGKISFEEAMYDVIQQSAIAATVGAGVFAIAPTHLAAKRTMHVVTKGPAVITGVALAAAVVALTTPRADVEHGPYGTVKVTPRLGIF